jgi:hypothetical protein
MGEKEALQLEPDADGVAIVEGGSKEGGQEKGKEGENPGPFGGMS